jgi:hypothetical protein
MYKSDDIGECDRSRKIMNKRIIMPRSMLVLVVSLEFPSPVRADVFSGV